ncbi:zinc finger, c2h2 type domain containing protein [Trypanosoma grayi]|uniref:zinc finger, c2h2 type domain containing protein n=1 Tax=Trypanosoma grayi TaxID=71804 RepID=UPI0004F45070|nr:zinc finger, c2h2 type domain containing protein [Trypanosoma grayi]KEG11498.1 zinc finger, c2h2 type domain containing protein [Trypanosoma grayi]
MSNAEGKLVPVECLICAEACDALAVFNCGHFVCYICGLHIHAIDHGACPVCRDAGKTVIVTRLLPDAASDEEKFSAASLRTMKEASVFEEHLQCYVHGDALAREMAKMYKYVCPVPACWRKGVQDPFYELPVLREHLRVDHGLEYCPICLEHRSIFLCEQRVYNKSDLPLHMEGVCPQDSTSFLGHPYCAFCKRARFYDEDHLLKHMKHEHFTCDVCNRHGFTFTYYQNRAKLLRHFESEHKLCDHPTCAALDPMVRVFASDLDLAVHKQRVHGVRSRVTLFSEASATNPTGSSPGASASAAAISGTATAAPNANVLRVVFDHVSGRETEELMPTRSATSNHNKGRHSKKGGRGNRNGVSAEAAPHDAPGLPTHFRTRGVLCPLMHTERQKDTVTRDELHPRAFGVSESDESYNAKYKVPSNRAELQRALDTVLQEELKELHLLNDFRATTADFMGGGMLATRYYDCLRTEFFPLESAFEKVFPLLVATVPIPERKEALVQVEKMRNSPEVQHANRMQEEEAKKKAQEVKIKKQHELATLLQQKTNKRYGNKGGGRNVWLERGSAALISQQQQQQHSAWGQNSGSGSGIDNRNNNSNTNRPSSAAVCANSSWGSVRQQQQQREPARQEQQQQAPLLYTGAGYREDPEDFPELPSTNPRRAIGLPHAKRTQRPNAWQRR